MITNFNNYLTESLKDTSDGVFWGNIAGGVLPICTTTKRILVAYRSRYVQEPHTWGVWGGKIDEEDGEAQSEVQDAVKREFLEEAGYDGHLKLIPSYIFKTADESFKYYNFIGLLDEEFEPTLDWETESFKWMTFEELLELKPKHFGLKKLLNEDLQTIKKYCNI